MNFSDIPIRTDEDMPLGTITLRNDKDEVVGEIRNVRLDYPRYIGMITNIEELWLQCDSCIYPINCNRKKECIGHNKMVDDKRTEEQPRMTLDKNYRSESAPGADVARSMNGSPTFYKLLEKMARTHDKKSHDYASNDNPSGNYHFAGAMSKLFDNPDDAGFMGRIAEKIYRLANIENAHKSALNETVQDTEVDICTIVTLWMADRENRRAKAFIENYDKNQSEADYAKNKQIFSGFGDPLPMQGHDSVKEATRVHNYNFERELQSLLNRYNIDTELNTTDVALSKAVIQLLEGFL